MTPPPAEAASAAAARTFDTAIPAVRPRRRAPVGPSRPGVPLGPARRPRRVSGPAARPVPVAEPTFPATGAARVPARERASARNRGLAPSSAWLSHPLLDRLIGGRAWIGIVAFALIGIVTMQLGLLKLNAGIGRALEHEAALQRENSALSVENSEVGSGDAVELKAAGIGMRLTPAGALRFLSGRDGAGIVDRAAAVLRARASKASETSTTSASAGGLGEASATAISSGAAPGESATSTAASGEAPAEATGSTGETAGSSPGAAASGESAGHETGPGSEAGAGATATGTGAAGTSATSAAATGEGSGQAGAGATASPTATAGAAGGAQG